MTAHVTQSWHVRPHDRVYPDGRRVSVPGRTVTPGPLPLSTYRTFEQQQWLYALTQLGSPREMAQRVVAGWLPKPRVRFVCWGGRGRDIQVGSPADELRIYARIAREPRPPQYGPRLRPHDKTRAMAGLRDMGRMLDAIWSS